MQRATGDVDSLGVVLDLIRSGAATGRPDLQRVTGFGRGLVSERVNELLRAALVTEDSFLDSTGGRAARALRLNAGLGLILVCHANLADLHVGVADLSGRLLASRHVSASFDDGPGPMFDACEQLWSGILHMLGKSAADVWGLGVGLPAHADFAAGTLVDSPSLPARWTGFALRRDLSMRFGAPVWLETNDNLLALEELRVGVAKGQSDFMYLHADLAIGCGIVSGGRVMRGAQGAAGNIGHITIGGDALCRCGRRGCLEAVAGGEALLRDAEAAAVDGRSGHFADRLAQGQPLAMIDLREGVRRGDQIAQGLVSAAGFRIGQALATSINLLNPALVVASGCLPQLGDLFIASMREAVYRHSLPFVTRDLEIVVAEQTEHTGLAGAAQMVVDQLFMPAMLGKWFGAGRPRPDIHDDLAP